MRSRKEKGLKWAWLAGWWFVVWIGEVQNEQSPSTNASQRIHNGPWLVIGGGVQPFVGLIQDGGRHALAGLDSLLYYRGICMCVRVCMCGFNIQLGQRISVRMLVYAFVYTLGKCMRSHHKRTPRGVSQ